MVENKKYDIDNILRNNFYINNCIENNIDKKYSLEVANKLKVYIRHIIRKALETKPIFHTQIVSSVSTYKTVKTLIYTDNNISINFPDSIKNDMKIFASNNDIKIKFENKKKIIIRSADLQTILYYLFTGNTIDIRSTIYRYYLMSNVVEIPTWTGKPNKPPVFAQEATNNNWVTSLDCTRSGILFKCGIIKQHSIFYRGSSSFSLTSGSWFSPILENSILYMKQGGYLHVFKPKLNMNLFFFNNVDNINKLFKYFFESNQIVNYNIIKIVTQYPPHLYGKWLQDSDGKFTTDRDSYFESGKNKDLDNITVHNFTLDKTACTYHSPIVTRNSMLKSDILFLQLLCELKFDGYVQILTTTARYSFYPEIALCNPFNLELKRVYVINNKTVKDNRTLEYIKTDISDLHKKMTIKLI